MDGNISVTVYNNISIISTAGGTTGQQWFPLTFHEYIPSDVILDEDLREFHNRNLNIITCILHGISLLTNFVICFTGLLFKKWWKVMVNKLIVHLCIPINMMFLIAMVSESRNIELRDTMCVAVRATLQYIVLVITLWMLTFAIHSFTKIVLVFQKITMEHVILKSLILNWGLPLIPVAACIIYSQDTYLQPHTDRCNSSKISILFIGVIGPMIAITITNVILYFHIILTLWRKPAIRRTLRKSARFRVLLSTVYFGFFALGWSMSLVASIPNIPPYVAVTCWYLFCSIMSCQCPVLFIYIVILNRNTRQLWWQWLKCDGQSDNSTLK